MTAKKTKLKSNIDSTQTTCISCESTALPRLREDTIYGPAVARIQATYACRQTEVPNRGPRGMKQVAIRAGWYEVVGWMYSPRANSFAFGTVAGADTPAEARKQAWQYYNVVRDRAAAALSAARGLR